MAFDEVLLPDLYDYGFTGGPGFETTIPELDSGHTVRNIEWEFPLAPYLVTFSLQEKSQIDVLMAFWRLRFGRGIGFRFWDKFDYDIPRQVIGTTDTTTTDWQVFKTYSETDLYGTELSQDRPIYKIKPDDSEQVWVNSVSIAKGAAGNQYQIDYNTGIVTLGSTLAAQTGTDIEVLIPQFHVPVIFGTDKPQFVASQPGGDSGSLFEWTVGVEEIRDIS